MRVSNINTIKRSLLTLTLLFLVVGSASGQSVLGFPRAIVDGAQDTGVAITNPNPYFADVLLTLYAPDGTPVANGLINPVSYRIAPKSQLQMQVSKLFAAGNAEGWIQVTSTSSGLIGYYFNGDYRETLEGAETALPMLNQSIPLIREDPTTRTDLFVANPGNLSASLIVTYNNLRGDDVQLQSAILAPHGSVRLRAPSGGTTARISANTAVAALAMVSDADSLMFVNGQAVDQPATTRVVPHFMSGNGYDSELSLANPSGSAASATVTLFSQSGTLTQPAVLRVTIPARGSISLTAATMSGRLISPLVDGWLEIDSPNQVLTGVVKLVAGRYLTAIPLQRTAMDRLLFSQSIEDANFYGELDLVNTAAANASIEILLLRSDGTVAAVRTDSVPARSKYTRMVRDLFPERVGQGSAFVSIRSTAGIYGIEILGSTSARFLATVVPQRINQDFVPRELPVLPRITRFDPAGPITPGTELRMSVSQTSLDTQVLIGSLTLIPRFPAPGINTMTVVLPSLEPGFVNIRVRVRGVESEPIALQVLGDPSIPMTIVPGQAFYQKVAVTDSGLDLNQLSMAPIRSARVEVLDAATFALVSASETDERGNFSVLVPAQSAVRIRVQSRLRSTALRVVDNTTGNSLYTVETEFDPRENSRISLVDRSRVSGAFNILEMIQRGNDLVHLADVNAIPPTPTIFWSARNNTGTTSFNVTTNTARILGDRSDDSDEFDDAVILHEYAHMLAARFSRDDSPGSAHGVGEVLDPRLAWSEGWANFFSSAARSDAIYRDSAAQGLRVRIDVEDNQPANDTPGYWSEASIHSLLWDMIDAQSDTGDTVQYPIGMIWDAFADLRNDRFVYLPYFMERFLARNPGETETLRNMVQLRSIDFQPSVRPSVTNPWPIPIAIGSPLLGIVDSLTTKRTNLANSAHFYTFTTTGAPFAIRLDILGIAAGGNPNANDLDLFLTNADGVIVDQSDRGLNGQSELINRRLAAGTYVIEVRSYYRKAETNEQVFNSARYRLSVIAQ